MPNKKPDLEDRLQAAIAAKEQDPNASIRFLAESFGVSNTTLQNRVKGRTTPRKVAHESQQLLSHLEEKVIINRIEDYDDRGIPLRRRHVLQMVFEILKAKGRVADIGKGWVDRFVNRHPGIQTKVGKSIDKQRALATDVAILKEHLEQFYLLKSRYHVLPENVWNTDEKGLAMGLGGGETVLCRTGRRNPKIMQEGKRDWVTVIEAVGGDGKVLAPLVIHSSTAHLMGHHSNINYEIDNDAFFTYFKAGYTSPEIALDWFDQIFEPRSRPAQEISQHRILVLDGHSSHVNNIEYIEHAIANNVHLICLPAHTTHILQPLDIGLFSPLGQYYKQELEDFQRNHGPFWKMRKGDFYPMLQRARDKAMTSENVVSAWRASGMIPFNRQRVLQNPNLQLNATPTLPLSARYSGLCPIEGRNGRGQEIDELKRKAAGVADVGEATALLDQAIKLAAKAQTESILDKATIKQLETTQPSKPDRRQIKGRLLLHTKVLGELYKKRERDDLQKQSKAKARQIEKTGGKRQQSASKRRKSTMQKSVIPTVSESSEGESSNGEEEQIVCIFSSIYLIF